MGLEEALDSPGFWLLGGGAATATFIGYIASKRMGLSALSWWELIVLIIVELIVAAFFATRE